MQIKEIIPEFCGDCYDNGEKESSAFVLFDSTAPDRFYCEMCWEDLPDERKRNFSPIYYGKRIFIKKNY